VQVINNTGAQSGGGIQNDGTLTLTNVTLANNSTASQTGVGGGLFTSDFAIAHLNGVTVSSNTASDSAGIHNDGTMDLTNVTISGNTATSTSAGGLRNNNSATLKNVTIASNTAPAGCAGGLNTPGGPTNLTNTIIGNDAPQDCVGVTITSLGSNIDSDGTCGLAGPGDRSNVDPGLGSLANNGGPTETHALLAGSPAIDHGTSCPPPSTDQRGMTRPKDGDNNGTSVCDIGAVETSFPPPTTSTSTSTSSTTTTTMGGCK